MRTANEARKNPGSITVLARCYAYSWDGEEQFGCMQQGKKRYQGLRERKLFVAFRGVVGAHCFGHCHVEVRLQFVS